MASSPPLCGRSGRERLAGTPASGEGDPGGDLTPAYPSQGGKQGGAGQVTEAARAGAPASPESAERAPHQQVCGWGWGRAESLEVAGPGGATLPAVTLGAGHPLASPCVPAPRLQVWAPSPASSELAGTPGPAEAGRGARGEAPMRPALDSGATVWTRTCAGAWAKPVVALPRLCDLGPVSLLPPSNGRLEPRGCCGGRELQS